MPLFTQPVSFDEAIKTLQAKKLLPTNLTSAQLKELDAAIRRSSVFSATNSMEAVLQKVKDAVGSIIEPKQVQREGSDQTVTEGMNPATARVAIKKVLGELGYQAPDDIAGTIQDLASDARVNLVVRTNSNLAWGAGAFVRQNASQDEVDVSPALELYRLEDKKIPRDWQTRWMLAAQESGDTDAAACLANNGRMVALKSSEIWQALGDGAGGYEDTLENPYPPFAFNSGMWTDNVSRKEATELGLLDEGEEAKPAAFSFASLFKLPEAA